MTSDRLRALDEMVAKLLRDDSPIQTHAEPSLAPPVDQSITDDAVFEANVIETAGGENARTIAEQPGSPLAGLDLDMAIRLRWALRDIKAKRTKLSSLSLDDSKTLIELGLIEMRDHEPVLTNEGHRALDWS